MNVKDVYGGSRFKYTCRVVNGGSDVPGFDADLELSHAGLRRFVTKKGRKMSGETVKT